MLFLKCASAPTSLVVEAIIATTRVNDEEPFGEISGCRQLRRRIGDRPGDPAASVRDRRCRARCLAGVVDLGRRHYARLRVFTASRGYCQTTASAHDSAGAGSHAYQIGVEAMNDEPALTGGKAWRALRDRFREALDADDYASLRTLSTELRNCTHSCHAPFAYRSACRAAARMR